MMKILFFCILTLKANCILLFTLFLLSFCPIYAGAIQVHQQPLPLLVYFSNNINKNLDFMQSLHYVLGYSYKIDENWLLKLEGYYKDITKAPVEIDSSSFSLLNSGVSYGVTDGFDKKYVSTGKGRTYGAEFSLIKNFSEGYYITLTASYVRQQYTGSDGVMRFGAFDNIYILNILAGYEWKISDALSLEFSGKYTTSGGAPYTPIDMAQSQLENTTVYDNTKAFTLRYAPYSKFDSKIDIRHNFKGWALISYISAENLFDQKNIWLHLYNPRRNEIESINQMGVFIVGGIRCEF